MIGGMKVEVTMKSVENPRNLKGLNPEWRTVEFRL
jgi:hypothetical protein